MSEPRARSLHVTVAAYTALALAIAAVTGTAAQPVSATRTTSAAAVTGAGIKDGSVTGADIKDGSLTGADIKDGSLTGADVKDSSLTGADVKNGSLTGADLKKGSIPLDRLQGTPSGATGYTKAESDANFLAKTGKAADADKLDGLDSTAFAQGNVTTTSKQTIVPLGTTVQLATVPGWATVSSLNCGSTQANASVVITSPTAIDLWIESSNNLAGAFAANVVSAGTPLAANAWWKGTITQIAGTGDTSGTATIEIHTAATPSGCRYVVTTTVTH